MKPEKLLCELEDIAGKLFNEIRREQGLFQSGSCIFKGKRILFLNSRQALDERIAALAKEIARCNVEGMYLKPAIRDEVERHAQEFAKSVGN